jgi:glycosyltransferase involved in cell wall biosynthesis
LGYRSKTDLLELYNLSDVFVLASYSEGLPRVVIEAMACGCIPIATDVGSTAVIVKDGFNGFLVHTGDPLDISARIKQIQTSDREEIARMQQRACDTIRSNFDISTTARKMIEDICALETDRFLT